ncbi:DUF6773 family protein [Bacillus sp. (in: firmicutes)]|uniref:DUF6773 family protein n=1 Tax=Bacillus sp. TaxID=1409 RepID=UPI0023F23960|nr:DUF6773 family protein [Bacillus sp. (in: firmicutes)]
MKHLFFTFKDEYIERKMKQFYGEAGFLLAALMLADLIIRGFILHREPIEYMVSGIGFALFAGYILIRYLLSGLEHPDIATKSAYRKKRKEIIAVSVTSGVIFFIITILFTDVPHTLNEWLDALMLTVLFFFFYFMLNFLSLRSSFLKNKDLSDDK